jgi:XTP/dITP diphosphohydrolase
MPRLVIATNNRGKLREYQELLDGCGFELVTPAEAGAAGFNPEETGATYAENAVIKAREAARATGLPSLADDSGIGVDALGGRPGILSARYAGGDRTDPGISEGEQRRLLLGELRGVPGERRTARFVCVIAVATPAGEVRTVEAKWEGRIALEERGGHGFGYDPVFEPEGYGGKTSAELPPDEKNRVSHRGQAAALAMELLRELRVTDDG